MVKKNSKENIEEKDNNVEVNSDSGSDFDSRKKQALKKLNATIGKLNAKDESCVRFASNYYEEVTSYPIGFYNVDLASGINGMPNSCIIEVYGLESVGKSYFAQKIVSVFQKNDPRFCVYADLECGLEIRNMKRIGINVDELLILDFDIAEKVFDKILTLMRSGTVSCVVLDSVAALISEKLYNATAGDTLIADKARVLSQYLPKIAQAAHQHKVLVVMINQLRETLNYGGVPNTTGGRGLKYFSNMRLEFKLHYDKELGRKILNSAGEEIGQRVLVKFVKNKYAPPRREGTFDLLFAPQDNVRNVIFSAKKAKLWFTRNNVCKYKSETLGEITSPSEEEFVKTLVVNNAVEELYQLIKAKEKETSLKILPDDFQEDKFFAELEERKEKIFNGEDEGEPISDFEDFSQVINEEE